MSANNSNSAGVALDLNRRKKKRRIKLLRVAAPDQSLGAKDQFNSATINPSASVASLASASSFKKSPSKHRGVVLAKNVNADSLRSLGPTSPIKIDKDAGPVIDPKTKRVVERTILGTAEDFEEMHVMKAGANRGRTFQPRRHSIEKKEEKGNEAAPRMTSIQDSTFIDNQAEDDVFMYKHRLLDPAEVSKRRERIAEARKEEAEYMKEEEDSMLMCDLIVSRREQNALKNWKKIQKTWGHFRKQMAKELKKHPDDLVVSRSFEYREKREEYQMLEGATPADLKHGSEYWMMSLRGMGTRYVPVGNIFSGLFCPVNEDKEYTIDIIRLPGTTDPKRKNAPKNWRHSHTLMERQKRMKKKLMEMRPHFIGADETESLIAQAEGLFEWAERSSKQYFENQKIESEKEVGRTEAEDAETKDKEVEEAEALPEVKQGPALSLTNPSATANSVANCGGNTTRLLLNSIVGDQTDAVIVVKNRGTTALFYSWNKVDSEPTLDQSLTGGPRGRGQVYCRDRSGVLLPGLTKEFPFSFKSNIAGMFSEEWEIVTVPPVSENPTKLAIKAMVTEEDLLAPKRDALEAKLADQALTHGIEDMLRDIVRDVKTPPPPPLTEVELKQKKFEESNADLPTPLFYTEDLHEEVRSLAQKIFLATIPPPEPVVKEAPAAEGEDVEQTVEGEPVGDGSVVESTGEGTELDTESKSQAEPSEVEGKEKTAEDEATAVEPSAEEGAPEPPVEVAPVVIDREWGGTFSELVMVVKEEVMPLDMEVAESLLYELQLLQQQFAQPPVSLSSALSAGREFFNNIAMEIPSISDSLLEENGLEPRAKFKRPRSLKPGQEEDPNRKLAPRGGAWKVQPEEGDDDDATPESAYRKSLEKSVAAKLSEMIPSFVENAIATKQAKIAEERKLRAMELSFLDFPWKTQTQDDDEDAAENEDDENEEAKVVEPLEPVFAAINSGSVLLRADMNFVLEDEGDGSWSIMETKINDKRIANISANIKRLVSANALVITIVGHLGDPQGEADTKHTLLPVAEMITDAVEIPVQFVSSIEEATAIIDAEKEKKKINDEKEAAKVAAKQAKAAARAARRAEAGSDYESDDDDDDEDEEDEEEEEEDAPPCKIILLENVGYTLAEHSDYMGKLPQNAEEEDIEDRRNEIDEYCAKLSNMADIFINDDLPGSSVANMTISGVSSASSFTIPGLTLQKELQNFCEFFENSENGKKIAVVSGSSLQGKVELLRLLLQRVDEILIGGGVGPLFERVRREWDARNNAGDENAVDAEGQDGGADPAQEDNDEDGEEEDEEDEDAEDEDEEGGEPEGPVPTMTDEESSLLPIARLLFSDAKRLGVGIHLPGDYVLGDEPVVRDEPGYEVEYDGEAAEWVVPAVGAVGEDGKPVTGRAVWGIPERDMHILDIGPETQERYAEIIRGAQSVLWSGAVGEIQHGEGQGGTAAMLDAMAGATENGGKTLVVSPLLVDFLRTVSGVEDEALALLSAASEKLLIDVMNGSIAGVQALKKKDIVVPSEKDVAEEENADES